MFPTTNLGARSSLRTTWNKARSITSYQRIPNFPGFVLEGLSVYGTKGSLGPFLGLYHFCGGNW